MSDPSRQMEKGGETSSAPSADKGSSTMMSLQSMFGWDASTAQLRNLILFECMTNVFRALLDGYGPNRTLEAIRPYNNITGRNLANMARERFGLEGSDAEAIALPYYWCHYGTSDGNIKPMEIRDGKAIVEVYACPSTVVGAPAEICVAMSHYIAEGICQAINPAYEFVFTHHLANGDECCRYVVKKKTDKFSLDNPGRLEKTIPLELSQPEKDTGTLGVAFTQLNIFMNASVNLIGPQRTDELGAPLARKTGIKLGNELMEGEGGKGEVHTIKDKLDFIHSALAQRGNPAEITSSGIEKEITQCPFKNGLPEVCNHLEGVFGGVCEAINPDYEFAYDHMMSKGDHSCHWVVRKKSEKGEATLRESMQDDSLGY